MLLLTPSSCQVKVDTNFILDLKRMIEEEGKKTESSGKISAFSLAGKMSEEQCRGSKVYFHIYL